MSGSDWEFIRQNAGIFIVLIIMALPAVGIVIGLAVQGFRSMLKDSHWQP